jgi:serine/threonine protein kinase
MIVRFSFRGKYGVVYRCKEKANGQDVAVKVMMKRHNKKEDVEREVAILKELQHPNLLQFVDYTPDGTNFILVTEL